MSKTYIAYLQSSCVANFEYNTPSRFKRAIIEHEELEYYSIDDFVDAFNDEYISDLGYIIRVKKCKECEQFFLPEDINEFDACAECQEVIDEKDHKRDLHGSEYETD